MGGDGDGNGHFVPFDRTKNWTRFAFYARRGNKHAADANAKANAPRKGCGELGLLDSWNEHVRNLISFSFMYISLSKKFLATRQTTGHANATGAGIQCMPRLRSRDPRSCAASRRTWT